MLPGFRFLFAAIVLSMSILIFGLGAAALLRAAHEQFVSNPSWHAVPETVFAQQSDASWPVLAMMHVEPAVPERAKAPDDVPAALAPAEEEQATSVAPPAEPAPVAAAPTEPTPAEAEKLAAAKPEDAAGDEVAKPVIPAAPSSAPSDVAAAKTDAPVSPDAPAPAAETRIAATEQTVPPAREAAPVASEGMSAAPEPASAPASAAPDAAVTKIATLGGPPVTIEAQPPAKAADAKSDSDALKKRQQARRAAQRRRIASRARVARQATQQPASPFAQPLAQPPTAARNR
jgi:hypothetical protein